MGTKQIISCVLLTLALCSICPAQPVQFDVFPLKPGLQYHYVYHYWSESYWMGSLDVLVSDSGLVVYTIKDSVSVADSATVWTVEEKSTLWHRYYVGGDDTAYWSSTTTSGGLIENLAAGHALRCSLLVWSFPLQYPVKEMYRFEDTAEFLLGRGYFPLGPPGTAGYDSLWFSGSRGFYRHRRYSHGSAIGQYYSWVDVDLLGSPTAAQKNSLGLPEKLILFQNYPNPFNPSTTIRYELPRSSEVRLSVFDILGREVSVLVNERRDAGVHEVKFDGSNFSSGVYFYRLQAGNFVQSKKLAIVK
jgi:hypothetical protein